MHDSWVQHNNDATLYLNSNNHIHSMSHQYSNHQIDDKPYLNGFKQSTPTKSCSNNHIVSTHKQQQNSIKLNSSNNSTTTVVVPPKTPTTVVNSKTTSIINGKKEEEKQEKLQEMKQQPLLEKEKLIDANEKVENIVNSIHPKEIEYHHKDNVNEEKDIEENEIEDEDYNYEDEEEEDNEDEVIDYDDDDEDEYLEEEEDDEIEDFEEDEIEESTENGLETIKSIEKIKSSELDNSKLGNEDELLYLEYEWTFYYDQGVPKNTDNFSSHIESLGNFNTVQGFWSYWNNFRDLAVLPDGANLRLFKKGIKPIWEDKENENGGRWVFQTKGISGKKILDTVLAIIGEQFEYSLDICGFVYSVRPGNRQFISIWNKSGSNQEIIDKTLLQFSEKLNLTFTYTLHNSRPILSSPPLTPSTSFTNFGNSLNSSSGAGFTPIHHSGSGINTATGVDSPKQNYHHHKKSQSTSSLPQVNCTKQQQQQQQNILSSPFSSYSNRNTKFSLVNNNINNNTNGINNELLPSVLKSPVNGNNSSGNGNNRRTIDKHISSPSIPIPFSITPTSTKKEMKISAESKDTTFNLEESICKVDSTKELEVEVIGKLSTPLKPKENVKLPPKICNNIEVLSSSSLPTTTDKEIKSPKLFKSLKKVSETVNIEAISPLSSMAPNKEENIVHSVSEPTSKAVSIVIAPIVQSDTVEVDLNKVSSSVHYEKEKVIYEREDGGKHYKKGKDHDDDDEEEEEGILSEDIKKSKDDEEIEDIFNEEEIDTSDIPTDDSILKDNDNVHINSIDNNIGNVVVNKKENQTSSKPNKKKKSKGGNKNNNNGKQQQQSSLYSVNKGKQNNSTSNGKQNNISTNTNITSNNRLKSQQKSNIKIDIVEFLNEHIKIIIMLLLIIATTLIFQNL